jgi:hypothetical protein
MPLHIFLCDYCFLLQEKKISKTHLNCIWNNRKRKEKKMENSISSPFGPKARPLPYRPTSPSLWAQLCLIAPSLWFAAR